MAGFHVMADARGVHVQPVVRRITTTDLWDALKLGVEDFWAKPSHYLFLGLIYPIVGLILTQWTSGSNAIRLVLSLDVGLRPGRPFAAIGLYEIESPARARHEHLLAARTRRAPLAGGFPRSR